MYGFFGTSITLRLLYAPPVAPGTFDPTLLERAAYKHSGAGGTLYSECPSKTSILVCRWHLPPLEQWKSTIDQY